MDKKILKILQKIRIETQKYIGVDCKNNITEINTNEYKQFQAYNNCIKIIVDTLLEEDAPIPHPEQEEVNTLHHITLFEYGSYKVDIYHDNKNYVANFDGIHYSCNKLMDLKKDLQIAIVNKGIDKGEIVDHEEVLRNSSL